ncbi:BolA/IbaG family iron-sulfur metabolism protein [bacterium]|nr:BolA/IbaG family iron-sulfur metabolism protein [bacterium]
MPMHADDIIAHITSALPDAQVELKDLAGDGDHYAVTVLYKGFEGKTRVQQHRMVMDALQGKMGGQLHALAITTRTP